MNEEIIIPVSMFAMIFAMFYVYYTTRNKERMALIEKGADPALFKQNLPSAKYFVLKLGLLSIGVALGVLFGNLLEVKVGMEEGPAYLSMIFLFGGLGLVGGYLMQSKNEK